MKQLEVLGCGVRGAENGTVDIYKRGTSTRAQLFSNYDGTGAQTPAASSALDANGGLSLDGNGGGVYVNEAVTLVFRSATGVILRQFTAFDAATDVEVRSQSFTGVDYETAATGAGLPVLLSTVLDLIKTSFGTTDFNAVVDAAGTARTVSAALRAVSGMYFNVKEPAYGALGNGVADDRPAIQAAITAANAVGGTVYFPPGTYLIGAGLTVNGAAGFLGSTGVTVTSTVNGIQQLSVGTGATGKFTIENMIFTLSGTGSKWALVSAGTDLVMINSRVTNTATLNANGNILNVAAGGDVTLVGVRFDIPVDNAIASSVLAPTTPIIAVNCEFNVSGTGVVAARPIKLLGGALLGCRFSSSMAGGGSISGYIEHQSGAGMLVAGCSFPNPVAGTISFAMASVQSNEIVEIGNTYGSAVPVFGGFTILDASNQWPATHTMAQLEQFVASDAALLTLSSFHGAWRLQRTTGAAQTLTVGFPATVGQLASLTVINGAGTPTITLFNVKGLAAIGPLTANTRSTIIMRSVAFGGGLVWVLVSSTLNWT